MTTNHSLYQQLKSIEKEIKSLPQGGWYDDYKTSLQDQANKIKAALKTKGAGC